ncbi:MAG: DUF6174 domain-containing protein [Acidimicrobiia bacterium]|nr:DUF6174 domain-containing protein [Acidimicrobiia bacterium]
MAAATLAAGCADDSWVTRPDPASEPAPVAFTDTTTSTTTTMALASGMDAELAELDEARVTWAATGIDTYRFVIERRCLCEQARPAALVSVQQHSLTAAFELGPVEATPGDHLVTVEELHDEIEAALAAGQRVSAEYDPLTGVPTVIDLDIDAVGAEIRTRSFSDITGGRTDLIDAQGRWDDAGFSSYRWTYGVITFEGLDEVGVSVANGLGDGGLSVEEVYALIAEAHVNPDRTITASYDAELGLPLQVVIEQPMSTANIPFTFTGVISLEPT